MSIGNIVKRLSESRIVEASNKIVSISVDEDKLYDAMQKEGYGENEVFEFIYDIYGLEDGEDFQVGNGFDFLFYADTDKQESIERMRKDLAENVDESEKIPHTTTYNGYTLSNYGEYVGIYKNGKHIADASTEEEAEEYIDDNLNESTPSYLSVEYTYNGDDTSDYLGHVKVRTDNEDVALFAARKYAMNKHPEDDPRHFNISKDDYTNVDVVDDRGDYLTTLEEGESEAPHGSLESNVVEMYLNGDSVTEIAYNLNITRADVKVIIDDYMSSRKGSKSIDESKKIDENTAKEIESELNYALHKFMTSPRMGFPDDEVEEYSAIDLDFIKGGESGDLDLLKVEVRAELGYVALSDLGEELTKVIEKYEEDAYFEPEQPGILVAYLIA